MVCNPFASLSRGFLLIVVCQLTVNFSHQFASIVTDDCCQLYQVVRTNLHTWEKDILTYPPSDFMPAVERAAWYQRTFDPQREHYDWRVTMCS